MNASDFIPLLRALSHAEQVAQDVTVCFVVEPKPTWFHRAHQSKVDEHARRTVKEFPRVRIRRDNANLIEEEKVWISPS
ncbi:hypothetical protein CSW58_01735 [Caulobacter sp. B11]|nr:hypothetical protein CSW58_01735 [Caulobacter sp. B11]